MSDLEIRRRLKFTDRWYALGIVDQEWIENAVRVFRQSDDHNDEHYRYGAFRSFLQRTPKLAPEQCEALMELGAGDPDQAMGTSMMLDVLRRPECPKHLFEMARNDKRTEKHVAKLLERRKFDASEHRAE